MNPKILSYLLLLAVSFKASGQQLPQGTFFLSTGFTYTEFNFKRNSTFDYKYSSCTGGQEGSGTYTFKHAELTLFFDNPTNKILPPTPVISKNDSKNDSTCLSFSFYDPKDSSAVAGVRIEYKDRLNGNSYGAISNEHGKTIITLPNTQLPIDIKIMYIGTDPETIRFDSSGFYTIIYPLNFSFIKPLVKGQILQFTVDDFGDDELVLKPVGEKEFRTFQRKEE